MKTRVKNIIGILIISAILLITGNAQAATVLANGWQLQITIPSAGTGGVYNLGTDTAPTVSMTVTSKSWTTAGVESDHSMTDMKPLYTKNKRRKLCFSDSF